MAKIYLCKYDDQKELEFFTDSNGKRQFRIWTVERKLKQRVGIHASFARICNKDIVIDATAPTFVDELPKDAIEVNHSVVRLLNEAKTHYWGNLRLTESEMEKFLITEGYEIEQGNEKIVDSTLVFDYAIACGFRPSELDNQTYVFEF